MPAVLLLACACAGPVASAGAASGDGGSTKLTYRVPVSQPDEYGASVSLDTDVYLPRRPPPAGGHPLLEIFHGGGSSKDNGFDADHARRFAGHGYVVILYSARAHGASDGQTTVAGPKEIRDLFDVTAWALRIAGRRTPAHASFHIDRGRIALTGYSQGGLHTNLGQVWAADRSIDPYGIRFRGIEPANTPDVVFNALVTHQVVKLSFGIGLLGTYFQGTRTRVAPVVDKWIATATADEPPLYGGATCDARGHDRTASTMKQDLAWRSVGCFPRRLALPWHWAQAFDDTLFPPDMAISMWRRAPHRALHHLYLSMGGHAAPSAPAAVEEDKLRAQMAFLDAVMAGRRLPGPPVVYWTRDPRVAVPAGAYAYPPAAWYRQTSASWPPRGIRPVLYRLGADGRAVRGAAAAGSLPLAPLGEDEATDPVAQAALSGTPLGTSPARAVPPTDVPGFIAAFRTAPFGGDRELSGAPVGRLAWTPASPDTQLVLKVFDVAPDGRLTLLTRGVTGLRGALPGGRLAVRVAAATFSARIRRGHRVLAWVMAGDVGFYKPYPRSAGGVLQAGSASTLTLPLRDPRAARTPARPRRPRRAPRFTG